MRGYYFYSGLATLLHFAITGILMKENFFELEIGSLLVRMMFRTNHIYILFSGLGLLLLSQSHSKIKVNLVQLALCAVILLANIGINLSFYIDPIAHLDPLTFRLSRAWTQYSILAYSSGVGMWLVFTNSFVLRLAGRNIPQTKNTYEVIRSK